MLYRTIAITKTNANKINAPKSGLAHRENYTPTSFKKQSKLVVSVRQSLEERGIPTV